MTSSSTDAQRRLPVALALGVVTLVVAYLWFAVTTRFFTFATVALGGYAVAFAVSGTLVWLRRPEYLTGRLMVLACYLTLITPLQRLPESGALFAIGTSLNGLQEAVPAYLLLTYPSGRAGRGFVGALARSSRNVDPGADRGRAPPAGRRRDAPLHGRRGLDRTARATPRTLRRPPR